MPEQFLRCRKSLLGVSLAATLGAIALAGFGLYWATSRSDAVSVERQIRTTEHAIDLSIDELAKEQETVAVWDDAVLQLNQAQPDWQWFDDNIAYWLHDLFGHNQVYVLDPQDRPIYAMSDGERLAPASYSAVARETQVLVDAVRGRTTGGNSRHDRNPGQAPAANNTLLTTANAIHDSHLLQVLGRPAAVSAMRIVPLTEDVQLAPGSEHLLISVRFLDGEFLSELSKRNLIAQPRFSKAALAGPDEQSLHLTAESGKTIGYFFWRPELPGTELLRVLAPLAALAVALMAAGMALLARWLWLSTGQLQDTMTELETTMVELQASEAQAQHLAFHDVLTGLPNRSLFNDRVDQALARARRGEKVALLALDLDRFKHVNDTLGHHAGDALIRELARRLSETVREGDTVSRLGGDEFAVALVGRDSMEVEAICDRILSAVREPFDVLGSNAFVGISIGVVHAPRDGLERIDLMRKADIALYRAKSEGRDCHRVFTLAMDETVRLRGTMEEELREAMASGDCLRVFYQPQVSAAGQSITGLEALIRPAGVPRQPSQSLPIQLGSAPLARSATRG